MLGPIFVVETDTATTEIDTLSLHDALPIFKDGKPTATFNGRKVVVKSFSLQGPAGGRKDRDRSEEHTSELQSPYDLVCRLLLEKKKQTIRKQRLKTRRKHSSRSTNNS